MTIQKMYNPLTNLVRRIIHMVRESLVLAFGVVVVALFAMIGTVTTPLFLPITPNWGLALSRLYWLAIPMIACIIFLIYFWKNVEKMDKVKDDKFIARIKTAFKEVLKEDREERK